METKNNNGGNAKRKDNKTKKRKARTVRRESDIKRIDRKGDVKRTKASQYRTKMREERKRFKKIRKSLRNLGGRGPKTWRNEEIGPTMSRPRDGVAKMGLRGHHKHLRIKQHRMAKLCRTKLLKRKDLLWKWKITKWKRKEHTKRDNKFEAANSSSWCKRDQ